MNNKRRKMINKAKVLLSFDNKLEDVLNMLEDILYEEEDSYYNIPENLLYSQRAEESEDAIDILNDAIDELSTNIDMGDSDKTKEKRSKVAKEVIQLLNRIY